MLSPPQLLECLTAIGGSDTAAIRQATSTLKQHFKNPESMPQLLELSQSGEVHPYIRQLSLIFLRQFLIKLWSAYDAPTQKTFKDLMLQHYMKQEDEASVLRALCHAIGSLSKIELGNDEWPELLQYILQSLENGAEAAQLAAMELLSNIIEYVRLTKEVYASTFTKLLETQLQNPKPALRLLAVRALLNLLEFQRITPKLMKHLQPLIPLMLKALVLQEKEVTVAVFEVLCDLIEIKDFLNPHLPTLVPAAAQLIVLTLPHSDDQDLTELACFFLEQVSKFAHEEMNPELLKAVLEVGAKLCEGREDEQADEEEKEERTTLQEMGESLIGFFANHVKKSLIFPILSKLAENCIQAANPKQVKAGIKIFGAMAEGCKEKLKPFIGDLTATILGKVREGSPIVAEEASLTFAKFSEYLVPQFLQLHAQVLPSLLHTLTHASSSSVQSKVLFAVSAFCEQCIDEITDSAQALLKAVVPILQNPCPRELRYQAISAIQAISGAAPEQTLPYYSFLIDLLSSHALSVRSGGDKALASIALQAAGRLALAAGKEQFESHKEQLSGMALEGCQAKSSELKEAGFNYFSKIIQLFGEELAPVLETLMPLLLNSVVDQSGLRVVKEKGAKKKMAEFSLDSDSQDSDAEEKEFAAKAGDVIEYNSPVLDQKTAAIHCLGRLALYCTGPMLPYYKEILAAFDRIDPHFCEQVRYQMIESYGQLVVALQKHENPAYDNFQRQGDTLFHGLVGPTALFSAPEVPLVQPLSQNTLKLWKQQVRSHLLGVVLQDEDRGVVAHAVETVEEMVHLLGPGLLQDDDLTHITKLLLALFTQQTNCQVGQSQQEVDNSDDDYVDEDEEGEATAAQGEDEQNEEDEEDDDEEDDHEEDVMGATCDLLQEMGRVYGDAILPQILEILEEIWKYTTKGVDDHVMIIGLVADLMNSVPSLIPVLQTKHSVIEHLVSLLQKEDSDHRLVRNCIFAVGVIIHRAPQLAINYGLQNFETLLQQVFKKHGEGHPEIKDNTLGAFARIVLAAPENPKALEYLEAMLKEAPLTSDYTENVTVLRVIAAVKASGEESPAFALLATYWQNVIGILINVVVDERCDAFPSAKTVAARMLKETLHNPDATQYAEQVAGKLSQEKRKELEKAVKGE